MLPVYFFGIKGEQYKNQGESFVNNNERELEKAGYDDWKLSNGDDEYYKNNTKEMLDLKEKVGVCPCCKQNVYDNQLFVDEDDKTYHFSCYNYQFSSHRGLLEEENDENE